MRQILERVRKEQMLRCSILMGVTGLALLILSASAQADIWYFDPNGSGAVSDGNYTWDTVTSEWSTSSALSASPQVWNTANSACFTAGNFSGTIDVEVDSSIGLSQLYNGALNPPGCTLTLSGAGSLNFAAGQDGVDTGGLNGAPSTFDIPLNGAGQILFEGSDSVYLNAANGYTGGTQLAGGGAINFSTSSPFGAGTVVWDHSTMVLASQGSSALNIANPFTTTAGQTLVFVGGASAPTTFSGSWTLPELGSTATVQVNAGTPMTLSGGVAGAGNLSLAGGGQLILSGVNNNTGSVTVGGTSTLTLGKANSLPTASSLILAGGTLDPDGNSQNMSSTTLGLSSSSAISFANGPATLDFANSSALAWSGTLDLLDYNGINSIVNVGANGLSSGQLADLEQNNNPATIGLAYIDSSGNIQFTTAVPEPSTFFLGAMGALGFMFRRRRR